MNPWMGLHIELLSDTAFGRGDGVAGLVDAEVQHDSYGFPYLSGKTLKGLLMAECAEVLGALEAANPIAHQDLLPQAAFLFGDPGSEQEQGYMHVGNACLPEDFRAAVALQKHPLSPDEVLEAFTTLRRQTAMDAGGAPKRNSLRTQRVILRQTAFEARLDFISSPVEESLALLAACVLALRRAGSHRHRGEGRIRARLHNQAGQDVTDALFVDFERQVR